MWQTNKVRFLKKEMRNNRQSPTRLPWKVINPGINIQQKASGKKYQGTARKRSRQIRHDPNTSIFVEISFQCNPSLTCMNNF